MIEFYDEDNKIIFSIPDSNQDKISYRSRPLFANKVTLPVYLGNNFNIKKGHMDFYYSINLLFYAVILIWLLLVVLGWIIFLKYEQKVYQEQETELKIKNAEYMLYLSKQVSHDIRSPLSVINLITAQLKHLPNEQSELLNAATKRISEIANTLLKETSSQYSSMNTPTLEISNETLQSPSKLYHNKSHNLELIIPLVKEIIAEKRLIHAHLPQLEIILENENLTNNLKARIDPSELKRVLSNLINNSIEALVDFNGKVIVCIERIQSSIIITVKDNGKGIPEHILNSIGTLQGISHGKSGTESESGSGLGVYHAKRTIESFGGELKITSTTELPFNGTTIEIWLNSQDA